MFRWALAIGLGAAACAAGQTKSPNPPHTPDGQPDLQGLWTNATLTPLERPADLASKQFLTEQEAKEFAKRALNDVDADRRDGGGFKMSIARTTSSANGEVLRPIAERPSLSIRPTARFLPSRRRPRSFWQLAPKPRSYILATVPRTGRLRNDVW